MLGLLGFIRVVREEFYWSFWWVFDSLLCVCVCVCVRVCTPLYPPYPHKQPTRTTTTPTGHERVFPRWTTLEADNMATTTVEDVSVVVVCFVCVCGRGREDGKKERDLIPPPLSPLTAPPPTRCMELEKRRKSTIQ